MFDSRKELLDRMRLGEATFLELKEVRFAGGKVKGPGRDELADELAAFANGRGGVCLLGVADRPREIVGIPVDRLEAVIVFVREICTDSIDPPLAPVIDPLWLPATSGEELAVVKIDVPRSLFVHRSPGGFLHRVGDAKRVMSSEYLGRLFEQRRRTGIVRFDEQSVASARIEDLAVRLWERFRTSRTGDARDGLLTKMGLARGDEVGTLRPTVAGVLMATDDPRRWLPNAFIQAVAYRGTRIQPDQSGDPYQLDAADIAGPLDAQVEQACRFVARNMKVAAFKHLGRADPAAVRHGGRVRGGRQRGRPPGLLDSRIQDSVASFRRPGWNCNSPGGIPNAMTVEGLAHLQSARNEVVTSLLAKCPVPADIPWLRTDRVTLMDKRGEGVRLILDNGERLAGRTPEYRLVDEAELVLTMHGAGAE